MIVEADVDVFAASEQRTTVPFKPMLTESMDSVAIRGIPLLAEILMKVNEEPFTTNDIDSCATSLELINAAISSSLPCSFITLVLMFHSKNSVDAVHVI